MSEQIHTEPGSSTTAVCGSCGAEGQVTGQPCQQCERMVVNIPGWAQPPTGGRRWLTRRRLVRTTIIVVALFIASWLYYPFFPNPVTLIFKAPSTEASSDSAPGQWSMAGGNLQLTRYVPAPTAVPEGRVAWSRHLGTPTRGVPVVRDGMVYVGAFFKIIALDAATGERVWELDIPSPLDHSVAVAGNALYVGLLDHRVVSIDLDTRTFRWEFKTEGPITSAPIVANGTVYVGSGDSSLYALDAADGKMLWREDVQGELRSAPAVSDGLVFAADNLGNLYIFDARTGQAKLRFRTDGNTKGSPVVANGLAYFPSGGRLYAVDAHAREIAGEFQFKRVWSQFWVWKIPGVPRPPVQKGGKWLFDPDYDPRERTTTGFLAAPAVTGNSLFVGSFHGTFYAADADDGHVLWRFDADDAVFESAVVVVDRVYFGTSAGSFNALNAADGRPIWRVDLAAPIEVAPVFADGRFYVRTTDGTLHAIQ